MLTPTGIHHVSILVTDLDRSKKFYREVLGLQELERPPFAFKGAWFSIGNGGQQLHLIVHDGETRRVGGIDSRDGHFAIRVSSYREAVSHLESLNVEHDLRPRTTAGFPQIFLLDPDRNIIEINAEILD